MSTKVCIAELVGDNNYAVISPDRLAFGLGATRTELQELVAEESALLSTLPDEVVNNPQEVSLGLIPTFDCNLRCGYCYARGGESKEVLSIETGRAAIRSVVDTLSTDQWFRIYLVGGGEPLLHMEVVKPLIAYAREYSSNRLGVSVVTNGTFGEDTLTWLLENDVAIRVSFDGVMQEEQRPFANGTTSAEAVMRNIRKLVEAQAFVIVQSIVTDKGLHSLRTTADLLYDLGIAAWKVEPVQGNAISRTGRQMEPDPIEYSEALLDCIRYIAKSGYQMTLDTGFFGRPSDTHYCGMSVSNRIVTPEGLVTSCVEVARSTDPFRDLVMTGRVKDGKLQIDELQERQLEKLHFNNQLGGCSECEWRYICGGGCPMASIWQNGYPPLKKSAYTCSIEHWLLPRLLLAIAEEPGVAQVVMEHADVQHC